MTEGINLMVSGDFRCGHLKTKTFGLVEFEYHKQPAISVIDNRKKWMRKIDEITVNADYEIKEISR
ncbi:MAG: hypothetical protein CMK89_21355 [Pseudomonadales bacterium]|nr:hypothetical protein [Pseudomonadales bacterium]